MELVPARRRGRRHRAEHRIDGAGTVVGRTRSGRPADGVRLRGRRRRGRVRPRPSPGHPARHADRATGRLPHGRVHRRGRRVLAGLAAADRAARPSRRCQRARPPAGGPDTDPARRRGQLPRGGLPVRRDRRRRGRLRGGGGRPGRVRAGAGRLRGGQPRGRAGVRPRPAPRDAGRAVRRHGGRLRARRAAAVGSGIAAGADRLRLPRRPHDRAGARVRHLSRRVPRRARCARPSRWRGRSPA